MAAKFGVFVDEDHSKLPTIYWLPKLHKQPYKSLYIANSSSCTATGLSILLKFIRFARASSYVADFNTRNKLLTQKLLKQGYQYHKLRKTFSKFYRRYYDLISKSKLDLNLSCAKDFQNLISMVTWCIS